MSFETFNARLLLPTQLARTFVSRPHDEQLLAAIRERQRGNILLVGRRGSGKTTTIKWIANQLTKNGTKHQLIFPSPETLTLPLMSINLFDDFYLYPHITHFNEKWMAQLGKARLLEELQLQTPTRLNILCCLPMNVSTIREAIPVHSVVEIGDLSAIEVARFASIFAEIRKSSVNQALASEHEKLLREYLAHHMPRSPRELLTLLQQTFQNEGQLKYVDPTRPSSLEIVRPQLVVLADNVFAALQAVPTEIHKLSPTEFELLVAELFERDGYSVELTRKSRDGGVDIFAKKNDIGGEHLTVVQCKKYKMDNPVRVHFVREIAGSMNIHSATAGAIFTTSRFTKDAVEESKKLRYRLSLTDYFSLMKILSRSS